jgi:hypothetical protein
VNAGNVVVLKPEPKFTFCFPAAQSRRGQARQHQSGTGTSLIAYDRARCCDQREISQEWPAASPLVDSSAAMRRLYGTLDWVSRKFGRISGCSQAIHFNRLFLSEFFFDLSRALVLIYSEPPGRTGNNDAGLRNYFCNWPIAWLRDWVLRSRIDFLSTAPSRKTTTLFNIRIQSSKTDRLGREGVSA